MEQDEPSVPKPRSSAKSKSPKKQSPTKSPKRPVSGTEDVPPPKRKKSTIRRVMLTVEDDPDGELDEESDHEDQSTVVPVPASGPAPPVRDLRSHDHIVKLFSKAFQLVRASAKQGDIVDDATRDQFYGLIEYTGSPKAGFKRSRTQASSMGGGTTQASSNSGSKRFKPSATFHGASHGLGPVQEGGEQSRAT